MKTVISDNNEAADRKKKSPVRYCFFHFFMIQYLFMYTFIPIKWEEMPMQKKEKRIFAVNLIVVPLTAVFAVLIAAVIFLIYSVNTETNNLVKIMIDAANYQQTATGLQVGTTALSETATAFVQNPVIPQGNGDLTINAAPLSAYASELGLTRRGPDIAEQFKSFGVNEDIQKYIDTAAEYSVKMQEVQSHAISLIDSVYPLPDEPAFERIPLTALTEGEMAMPEEARIAAAKRLLVKSDYTLLKPEVSENVEKAHMMVQFWSDSVSARTNARIKTLRTALWVIMLIITLLTVAAVWAFYRWIVMPLNSCAEDMSSDRKAKESGRIKEFRSMVTAFNGLLDRRLELEDILRSAAETDPLTGLPNRYHYEQSIMDLDKKDGTIALILFDVDFLKETNDTKGHAAGDRLLRKAAEVIAECFGANGGNDNCYRIGGDEFAAILRGFSEAEVKKRIESFESATERENISVSVGYAFDRATDGKAFRLLVGKADKSMYENKKRHHGVATSGNLIAYDFPRKS